MVNGNVKMKEPNKWTMPKRFILQVKLKINCLPNYNQVKIKEVTISHQILNRPPSKPHLPRTGNSLLQLLLCACQIEEKKFNQ